MKLSKSILAHHNTPKKKLKNPYCCDTIIREEIMIPSTIFQVFGFTQETNLDLNVKTISLSIVIYDVLGSCLCATTIVSEINEA